ncbi:mucin-16-like, partial [Eublepharis macularius]|uniref:Mucin-16-like n=1 Tax=Eublepharis macularius TaxID=481883 RepID=A0AA97KYL9_EUBMA
TATLASTALTTSTTEAPASLLPSTSPSESTTSIIETYTSVLTSHNIYHRDIHLCSDFCIHLSTLNIYNAAFHHSSSLYSHLGVYCFNHTFNRGAYLSAAFYIPLREHNLYHRDIHLCSDFCVHLSALSIYNAVFHQYSFLYRHLGVYSFNHIYNRGTYLSASFYIPLREHNLYHRDIHLFSDFCIHLSALSIYNAAFHHSSSLYSHHGRPQEHNIYHRDIHLCSDFCIHLSTLSIYNAAFHHSSSLYSHLGVYCFNHTFNRGAYLSAAFYIPLREHNLYHRDIHLCSDFCVHLSALSIYNAVFHQYSFLYRHLGVYSFNHIYNRGTYLSAAFYIPLREHNLYHKDIHLFSDFCIHLSALSIYNAAFHHSSSLYSHHGSFNHIYNRGTCLSAAFYIPLREHNIYHRDIHLYSDFCVHLSALSIYNAAFHHYSFLYSHFGVYSFNHIYNRGTYISAAFYIPLREHNLYHRNIYLCSYFCIHLRALSIYNAAFYHSSSLYSHLGVYCFNHTCNRGAYLSAAFYIPLREHNLYHRDIHLCSDFCIHLSDLSIYNAAFHHSSSLYSHLGVYSFNHICNRGTYLSAAFYILLREHSICHRDIHLCSDFCIHLSTLSIYNTSFHHSSSLYSHLGVYSFNHIYNRGTYLSAAFYIPLREHNIYHRDIHLCCDFCIHLSTPSIYNTSFHHSSSLYSHLGFYSFNHIYNRGTYLSAAFYIPLREQNIYHRDIHLCSDFCIHLSTLSIYNPAFHHSSCLYSHLGVYSFNHIYNRETTTSTTELSTSLPPFESTSQFPISTTQTSISLPPSTPTLQSTALLTSATEASTSLPPTSPSELSASTTQSSTSLRPSTQTLESTTLTTTATETSSALSSSTSTSESTSSIKAYSSVPPFESTSELSGTTTKSTSLPPSTYHLESTTLSISITEPSTPLLPASSPSESTSVTEASTSLPLSTPTLQSIENTTMDTTILAQPTSSLLETKYAVTSSGQRTVPSETKATFFMDVSSVNGFISPKETTSKFQPATSPVEMIADMTSAGTSSATGTSLPPTSSATMIITNTTPLATSSAMETMVGTLLPPTSSATKIITNTTPLATSSALETTIGTSLPPTPPVTEKTNIIPLATSSALETITSLLPTSSATKIITNTTPLAKSSEMETTAGSSLPPTTSSTDVKTKTTMETSLPPTTPVTEKTNIIPLATSSTLETMTTTGTLLPPTSSATEITSNTTPLATSSVLETTVGTSLPPTSSATEITNTTPLATFSAMERAEDTSFPPISSTTNTLPIATSSVMETTTTTGTLVPPTSSATKIITNTTPLATSSALETTTGTLLPPTSSATEITSNTTPLATSSVLETTITNTTPLATYSAMETTVGTSLPPTPSATGIITNTTPLATSSAMETTITTNTTPLATSSVMGSKARTSLPPTSSATEIIANTTPLAISSALETTTGTLETQSQANESVIYPATEKPIDQPAGVGNTTASPFTTPPVATTTGQANESVIPPATEKPTDRPASAGNTTASPFTTPPVATTTGQANESVIPPATEKPTDRPASVGNTTASPFTTPPVATTTFLPTTIQTPKPMPAFGHFTMNLTVTNLRYKNEMGISDSSTFNSTERTLVFLIGRVLKQSYIGPAYIKCEVTSLRSLRNGNETGVDAICTYRNDSTMPPFDEVKMYGELVNQTQGFTTLRPYKLDRFSLYVNDYNEAPQIPTILPTTTQTSKPMPAVGHFTMNLTVTNLRYKNEMGISDSSTFNSTERTLVFLIGRVLKQSYIGPVYIKCEVTSLRSLRNGNETGVDAICTYRNDSTMPPFDKVKMYGELVNQTQGFTTLRPYKLDRFSLYVNDYNEVPQIPTILPTTTQTSKPMPAIGHFTMNLTVTNLRYKNEMGISDSSTFNSTERTLVFLIGRVLKQSYIGPVYIKCEVTSLRSLRNGNETGVDAICTYRNDSTMPPFDKVKMYGELVNQTQGFTTLRPYKLDRFSLYVNDYNEVPQIPTILPTTTQTSKPMPAIGHFTMNLTVTNLRYKNEMGISDSSTFNSTERTLVFLIGRVLKQSYIGPVYIKCEVTSLRSLRNGNETGVDAICTYRNDSTMPPFDKVKMYGELVNQTQGFTTLRPYKLDRFSLYVNDYNEVPQIPTILPTTTQTSKPMPAIGHFTMNLTVTNLRYKNEMGISDSSTFNSTERTLVFLIGRVLKQSYIGPVYIKCEVTSLRSLRNGNETGVDAICTYRNDSTMPPFDKVKMYGELVNQTQGFTTLRPYKLDRFSLYVNDYNEVPQIPTILPTTTQTSKPMPAIGHFTMNLTVTNLRYKNEMGISDSSTFNSTERTLVFLIGRVLKQSYIGPVYIKCEVTSLRSLRNGNETGVDAICTYRNDSTMPPFDKVKMYGELVNQTQGFTTLRPYKLDRFSLYVNDYNEVPQIPTILPTTTQTSKPMPAIGHFTMNLTVTNLRYKNEMGISDSSTFNSTERTLVFLIGRVLKQSYIGPVYIKCEVTSLRSLRNGNETGVDAICTYRNDSTMPPFDKVKMYGELVNQTQGFTTLRPYKLDRFSLYVNGYNEAPQIPTILPTTTQTSKPMPAIGHFTMNLTVTNLRYKNEMGISDSSTFNSTERTLVFLIGRVLKQSYIGPVYIKCEVTSLRSLRNGNETGVDAICTYRNDSTMPPFDKVKMYGELVNLTQGFTTLRPYKLDRFGLYVNGYHESAFEPFVVTSTTRSPTTQFSMTSDFTVNFTVTNLKYKPGMGISYSKEFNSTRRPFDKMLGQLLEKSSVGPWFVRCSVKAFRPINDGSETAVDNICTYRRNSTIVPFDEERVYQDFVSNTNSCTEMGPYSLDQHSLFVNGYHESPHRPASVPTTPAKPTSEEFTVNFTVTNLKYKPEMADPSSKVFTSTNRTFTTLLGRMLQKILGPAFAACSVTVLRSMNGGMATGVDSVCTYKSDSTAPQFDQVSVHRDLTNETNGFTQMRTYSLDRSSLCVNGYCRSPSLTLPDVTVTAASTTTKTPTVGYFTVNCTFTNLPYTRDLGVHGSRKFNSTQRVMRYYMEPILKNTSIGSAFIECQVENFRAAQTGNGVTMNTLCSYWKDVLLTPLDPARVHSEMSDMTNGGRRMGRYIIQENSLRVNGFPPSTRLGSNSPVADGVAYELGFTIISENLTNSDPSSPQYRELKASISKKLNRLFNESIIQSGFKICSVTGLRYGSIVVDCKCFFKPEKNITRDLVEKTFNEETQNATSQWLGDRFQLKAVIVRDLEPDIKPATHRPALNSKKKDFALKFTITNLAYTAQLGNNTELYQSTKLNVENELNQLFRNSTLGPHFLGCSVEHFRWGGGMV